MNKKLLLKLLLVLFFTLPASAQLPAFTLTVTPTPETCPGNGALAFAVNGTNPSASIAYTVYQLPNTTTPISIGASNTLLGLTAGNYQVVATQSLGAQSNTSSATVTIADNYNDLVYVLVQKHVWCPNDGRITVNVTSGTAVSYEITSGPATFPAQTSNVFNGLAPGTYVVRVYDPCGEAVVVTVQLLESQTQVNITPAQLDNVELPDCDHFEVRHTYYTTAGHEIFWPLTFEYTVYPPGGGTPQVVTSIYPTGSNIIPNQTSDILPFYYDQEFQYDLKVTDVCGNVYEMNDIIVNKKLLFSTYIENENCEAVHFDILPGFYVGPYTLTFVSAPAGFIPSNFNSSFPTFTDNALFGGQGNPVPYGNYSVQIDDACGHSVIQDFEVVEPDLVPIVAVLNGGCGGSIRIEIPLRDIVSVTLTAAPVEYTPTLPLDVNAYIDAEGVFFFNFLPYGTYILTVTDSCGDIYIVERDIDNIVILPDPIVVQRPGCDIGFGSVSFVESILDAYFTGVVITSAPASFGQTLPYDVSANLAGGVFYMNSFPEGDYVFELTNNCNRVRVFPISIQGHQFAVNDVNIIPHCGAFDIDLHHTSNGNHLQSFWLQKWNPVTNTWGHPLTGVPYVDGNQPGNTNSIYLNNNQLNISYGYTGQFRVIKIFFGISNGSSFLNRCLSVLKEFTFDDAPVITGAFSSVCTGGLAEVIIEAEGVPPLTYSIIEKNGQPFVVNNGQSGVFSGLEPGIYTFRVTDVCGNIRNIQYDINALDPISIMADGFCEGEDSTLSVQNFPFLTYEWWAAGSPANIISTTNVLDFPAFTSSQAGTYFVRITSNNPSSCANQILEYTIVANAVPNAGNDNVIAVCEGTPSINLETLLGNPHDTGGIWNDINNSGALTGSVVNLQSLAAGIYEFSYEVSGACNATDAAIIRLEVKQLPNAPVIAPVAPVCAGSPLQLMADEVAGVEYHWTGPNGFVSSDHNPLIISVDENSAGIYMLKFTIAECESAVSTVIVSVSPVPQFTVEGTTTFCEGQSSVLSVVPGNFDNNDASYQWYHGTELLPGVNGSEAEVFEPGLYEVSVTAGGCVSAFEIEVTNTDPLAIELASGCSNGRFVLEMVSDAGTGAVVTWTGPSGYLHTGTTADVTGRPPGEYFVSVSTPDGCGASGSIVVDGTFCGVPRGVSPNNDGLNDAFDLTFLGVREIMIFNRYGQKVYSKKDYKDEWHGQSEIGELPTGTYYYRLALPEGKTLTGWVYLQREN